MDLPFDGAISAYFENDAPEAIRDAITAPTRTISCTPAIPMPNACAQSL